MKFFHFADLHIGKSVNGFPMLEDQAFALEQIASLVSYEKPDAVLIAGDVYDKPSPGTEAVALFDAFLTALSREGTAVMIVSGNHDSPERLGFASGIMRRANVYIAGTFSGRPEIVTLSDEFGEADFYLLPFVRPVHVRRFFPDETISGFYDAVRAALGDQTDPNRRGVLLAHQFFSPIGVSLERSESEIDPIGSLDAVDAALLERFDYAALGHLHAPQNMLGGRARYAGSPLKYSLSERFHNKCVTMVELREKGNVGVRELMIEPRRDLRAIRGTLDALLSPEVADEGNRDDYIYVTLTDDAQIVDALERVRSVYPNCMALSFDNALTRAAGAQALPEASLSPMELFGTFYLEQSGEPLNEIQAKLFLKALEEAGDEAE